MSNSEMKFKPVWGNDSFEGSLKNVSFVEIMAEQVQEVNCKKEIEKIFNFSQTYNDSDLSIPNCDYDYELACMLSADPDCSNDFELAEKLQRQYDREIELEEKFRQSKEKLGVAKATLSVDSYLYLKKEKNESSEDEDHEAENLRKLATNLLYEKNALNISLNGNSKNHESTSNENNDRKCTVEYQFSNLEIGDNVYELSTKVLNDLRVCNKIENRRQIRLKDKDEKATNTSSIDASTRLILLKWINSGEFDQVEGIIAMGKESAVLYAKQFQVNDINENYIEKKIEINDLTETKVEDNCVKKASLECSKSKNFTEFAIKVFNTTLAHFRNRSDYVKNDIRFRNTRAVMEIWAEKEFANLERLRRANIKCPTAICIKKHVLLMSLIGNLGKAAPKLKDVEFLDSESKLNAFYQVKNLIEEMFNKCNLVHGDLSEFNLLWHNNFVYVIDVAQAMDLTHPSALAFLYRDIEHVLMFFERIGTTPLPTAYNLFLEVTKMEGVFDSKKNLLSQVEKFERENRSSSMRRDKAYPADMELRLYNAENFDRSVSPARAFN